VSERAQQMLWVVLAIIALGLSAATAYLYVESRRVSLTAGAAYRLAYTSIQEESQEKLSGHIQSCNLHGKNVAQLTDADAFDAFAACDPVRRENRALPFFGYRLRHSRTISQVLQMSARRAECTSSMPGEARPRESVGT